MNEIINLTNDTKLHECVLQFRMPTYYKIDFEKVEKAEDLLEILKLIIEGMNFRICGDSVQYENLKDYLILDK